MGNTMTLGKRISIGFGILVLITLILGAIGVINMRSASHSATKLSDIYVPEVDIASNVFKLANQIRYDMRGYVNREDEASLNNAKKNFVELKNELAKAEAFGKKYQLKALLENEKVASKGLAEYIASSERIEKALIKKKAYDNTMGESAAIFLKNVDDYLKAQDKRLRAEMEEKAPSTKIIARIEKIDNVHKLKMILRC